MVRITGRGITCGLSPGSWDWSLQEQAVIFKLVEARSIGVTLNESMIMSPVKSFSVLYGIRKEFEIPDDEHDCPTVI